MSKYCTLGHPQLDFILFVLQGEGIRNRVTEKEQAQEQNLFQETKAIVHFHMGM